MARRLESAARADARPRNVGGRPPRISREDILREAMSLPARELTLQGIATRLGVKTTALYHRFPSRDALLAAVSEELVGELRLRPADPLRWREWLRGTLRELHRFLVANPILLELESWSLVARRAGARLGEAALATLEGAGFETGEALTIWSATAHFVHAQARAMHEMQHGAQMLSADEAGYAAETRDLPRLRAAISTYAGRDPVAAVMSMLDGLVSLIAEPAPGYRTPAGGRT
jgi:TetR/AcrR family transcriptional regulator, tetracycline repressor protein